jgi:hypothetical protein
MHWLHTAGPITGAALVLLIGRWMQKQSAEETPLT